MLSDYEMEWNKTDHIEMWKSQHRAVASALSNATKAKQNQ